MPLSYPMVNGNRFDFSSVQLTVPDVNRVFEGVKSVGYSDELNPGKLRGNRAQVVGRTRGQYEASANVEMYKSEADAFLAALGPGYMERSFTVTVAFSEPATPDLVVVDVIQGCRIKKVEDSASEGEEAIAVKFDLDVLMILRNGKAPLAVGQYRP